MQGQSNDQATPEEIVLSLRNHEIDEEEAYAILLQVAQNYIIGAIRRKIGDESSHEISDIAAQVWVEIVSSLPRYDPYASQFTTWVFRIASNRAIDLFRKQRKTPQIDSLDINESDAPTPQELYPDTSMRSPLEEVAMKEMIYQAAQDLVDVVGDVDYDIHMLRIAFGDTLSFEQVTTLINRKHGTQLTRKGVENRFYRTQKKLRDIMVQRGISIREELD